MNSQMVTLSSEEELTRNYNKGGCPFTALRGGNYLGPHENVLRFFFLLTWIKAHNELKIPLHEYLGKQMHSYTYTVDV